MAGYSTTPLLKKLGIKPDSKVLFVNEPASIYKELGDIKSQPIKAGGKYDYVHFFTNSRQDLELFFKEVNKFLDKDGMLWVSWIGPTKSKRNKDFPTALELNENIIREVGLEAGLVDVKVAAIDDTWSALKFVFRLKDR